MKQHKGFLLATAGSVAMATGAQAADVLKAPAYTPPPPVANWTGFYIGLHAGGNWQQADNNSYAAGSTSASGFIGGGQIGYNWQHGNMVYGIEADGSGLSGKGADPSGFGYDWAQNQIRWLSTVRGRLGLAVGDTMAYATGGVAIGGVKNSVGICCSGALISESKTRVGWVIGGGIEHMWNRNWTVGLEALFVDLGKSDFHYSADGFKTTALFRSSNQTVIGRLKVNYKW